MLKIKLNKYYLIALVISAFLFTGCVKDETKPVSKGDADFSHYVAFGNSLTAGYADNALYYDGQIVSYPNLIAQQLKQVGGGSFIQPLVNPNSVGVGGSGNSRLILKVVDGEFMPVPLAAQGDLSIFLNSVAGKGPFNNMGVPGATVPKAVTKGYANPFFFRMAANFSTKSMLGEAVKQDPTFFTVFLGNNDVLSYALAGGAGSSITPMQGAVGTGFAASYEKIINEFTANKAKGALANIPDVASAAYFTFIPHDGLVLKNQSQVDGLNAAYAPLINAGLVSTFKIGANNFIIADADVQGGMRQMKDDELVLLETPQDSLKAGWGSITPIPDKYILTEKELGKIRTATKAYNQEIKSAADAHGLAYVDVNAFLKKVKSPGVMVNGRLVTADFITGGAFSLDGIHLTPLGNVLLANLFIKAINSKYDAFVPQVNPTNYGGVQFP